MSARPILLGERGVHLRGRSIAVRNVENHLRGLPSGPSSGAMSGHASGANLTKVNRGTLEISDTARDYYEALYDAGINYMDDTLRHFFAGLDDVGLRDDVTVVITADHGEAFLEHGTMVHGSLYPEVLHVPLLVLHPGTEGRRIPGLVESVDIAPTLYELAGIPEPSPVSGRSFARGLVDSDHSLREQAYAEMFEATDRTILRKQGDHLYQFMRFEPRKGGRGEVLMPRELNFDVTNDTLSFYARSYLRPRALHIFVDGQFEKSLKADEVGAGETLIEIGLPRPGERKRITLVSPSCDPVPRPRQWNSPCVAFFLRGLDFGRTELYDLSLDPQGLTDRTWTRVDVDAFRSQLETGRATHRRHVGLHEEPAAQHELPEDVRERLEALGYLQ